MLSRSPAATAGGQRAAVLLGDSSSKSLSSPWLFTARTLLGGGVERLGIEGSARAMGAGLRASGFFGQLLQSGNIQRYLAIFALGLAAMLYGYLTPPCGHRPQPASGAAAQAAMR